MPFPPISFSRSQTCRQRTGSTDEMGDGSTATIPVGIGEQSKVIKATTRGGSSLSITLPRPFVLSANICRGDDILAVWSPAGRSLVLAPIDERVQNLSTTMAKKTMDSPVSAPTFTAEEVRSFFEALPVDAIDATSPKGEINLLHSLLVLAQKTENLSDILRITQSLLAAKVQATRIEDQNSVPRRTFSLFVKRVVALLKDRMYEDEYDEVMEELRRVMPVVSHEDTEVEDENTGSN